MKIFKLLLIIAINIAIALAGAVYKCKVTSTDIKKGAGANYKKIGWLDKGDFIYATTTKNGWAKFHVGWVKISDLTKMGGSVNYKVTASTLNFRQGPGTDKPIITQKNSGTKIIYYGRDCWNNAWGITNYGYCSMQYITPIKKSGSAREIIDISQWNTINNYASAAAAIDGVLIRCGYRGYGSSGTLNKDKMFETHYKGFKGKTKIGYYFFSQAKTTAEAEAEATYVVKTLLKGKVNNFPIYWDSELSGAANNSGRADGLSKATRTACAVAFVKKVKALGYKAGVYASEYWFRDNLDFNKIVNAGASIWVAKYSSTAPSTSSYDAWQYTDRGSINGIAGNVDKSHVYKNIAGW